MIQEGSSGEVYNLAIRCVTLRATLRDSCPLTYGLAIQILLIIAEALTLVALTVSMSGETTTGFMTSR